jgi:flagellar hook-basal body complex protein FliE
MYADLFKTLESNQKLARDVATQIASAAVEYTKAVADAGTQVANTVRDQVTEAYKNVPTFPGFDTFTKTAKKSKAE